MKTCIICKKELSSGLAVHADCAEKIMLPKTVYSLTSRHGTEMNETSCFSSIKAAQAVLDFEFHEIRELYPDSDMVYCTDYAQIDAPTGMYEWIISSHLLKSEAVS